MKEILIRIILVVSVSIMCIGSYYMGSKDGYTKAKFQTTVNCGIVVKKLVSMKCPDIYKMLIFDEQQKFKGDKI